VTVQVDSTITQSGTVVGDFTMISVTQLYVGAMPRDNITTALHGPASSLPLHPTNNLRGCLREVYAIIMPPPTDRCVGVTCIIFAAVVSFLLLLFSTRNLGGADCHQTSSHVRECN